VPERSSNAEARNRSDHLQAVERVYGPETWEVYHLLDRSLDPRGPEVLLSLAAQHLSESCVVLDVGCRDAAHLIELVRITGARGARVEPAARLLEQARAAVPRQDGAFRAEFQKLAYPFGTRNNDCVYRRD
jgi:hypothetical protein